MRRYLLAAGLVLLAAGCGSPAPAAAPAAPAPTAQEAAQAKYLAVLDQQVVRYRDQSTAMSLADTACSYLQPGPTSASSREKYAVAMLTLKDVSSRDATIIVTAAENSGWCKARA